MRWCDYPLVTHKEVWLLSLVQSINKDDSGTVTALGGDLHLEGSVKTTKLKLTWLPKVCPLPPCDCNVVYVL